MDLDWCLVCDKHTKDGLYCSVACRLVDMETSSRFSDSEEHRHDQAVPIKNPLRIKTNRYDDDASLRRPSRDEASPRSILRSAFDDLLDEPASSPQRIPDISLPYTSTDDHVPDTLLQLYRFNNIRARPYNKIRPRLSKEWPPLNKVPKPVRSKADPNPDSPVLGLVPDRPSKPLPLQQPVAPSRRVSFRRSNIKLIG